jgi:hypothetical protein
MGKITRRGEMDFTHIVRRKEKQGASSSKLLPPSEI